MAATVVVASASSAAATTTTTSVEFNGVVYASKIEAKWACFFQLVGLQFEYEPGSYDVSSHFFSAKASSTTDDDKKPKKRARKTYTPDFYIPAQRKFPNPCWIEIKHRGGVLPTEEERHKAFALACITKIRVVIFYGDMGPAQHERHRSGIIFLPQNDDDEEKSSIRIESGHWWFRCPACGIMDISKNGSSHNKTCCECLYEDIRGDICCVRDTHLTSAMRVATNKTFVLTR